MYLNNIETGLIRPNNAIIFKLQVMTIIFKGSFQPIAQYESKRVIAIICCIK